VISITVRLRSRPARTSATSSESSASGLTLIARKQFSGSERRAQACGDERGLEAVAEPVTRGGGEPVVGRRSQRRVEAGQHLEPADRPALEVEERLEDGLHAPGLVEHRLDGGTPLGDDKHGAHAS
jgi:hypothetical protein